MRRSARFARRLSIVLVLFLPPLLASAQELSLDLHVVAPEGIETGDVFQIVLAAAGEDAGPALFPDPLILGPELMVLGFETERDSAAGSMRRIYEVMALGEGVIDLPAVPAANRAEAGFFSSNFELQVEPLESSSEITLREPDLLRIPEPREKAWPKVMLGLALIAAACLLGWFFLQRSKARLAPASPAASPEDDALAGLARLESALPLGQEDLDRFYVSLSRILRRFIEGRFGIPALERTKEEILEALDARGILQEAILIKLSALLHTCDRIKFADHEGSFDRANHDLADAGEVIRQMHEPRMSEAIDRDRSRGGPVS
jgi:hypothetical protein